MSTESKSVLPPELASWTAADSFDEQHGIHIGGSQTKASFPSEGLDVFDKVDQVSFWFRHRSMVIEDLVASRVSKEDPLILEVGSGSGVLIGHLSSKGYRSVAVEPGPGGAIQARSRGANVAVQGTLQEAAFPSEAFSVVGLFDVIEHLDDWLEVLTEARRVLRPDGVVIITVPAFMWLWSEHDEWNEHKRRYTKASLNLAMEEAGFESTRCSYFFAPLVVPALFRRLASSVRRQGGIRHEERLHDQLQPNSVMNTALSRLLRVEQFVLRRVDVPFGTSLFAVASPKGTGRR